jgi:hypothetical protein
VWVDGDCAVPDRLSCLRSSKDAAERQRQQAHTGLACFALVNWLVQREVAMTTVTAALLQSTQYFVHLAAESTAITPQIANNSTYSLFKLGECLDATRIMFGMVVSSRERRTHDREPRVACLRSTRRTRTEMKSVNRVGQRRPRRQRAWQQE